MDLAQTIRPRRAFARFRRLSWKLTLRYTFTTVLSLLLLELLLILVVLFALWNSPLVPATYSQVLQSEARSSLARYFEGETPDRVGLDSWLQSRRQSGILVNDAGQIIQLSSEDLELTNAQLLLVDRRGVLLGRLGQAGPPTLDEPVAATALPGLGEVLPRALAGEQDPARLFVRPSSDHVTIVAPIFNARGEVAGALIMGATLNIATLPYADIASLLLQSALIFTLLSALIGMVFGFFAARSLTRRLKTMALTAEAWGAGDFSGRIVDPSADEIGQLSRQLNRMAIQLQDLLQSRERLSVIEERNRLARELHDSVKQQVFAISMNLGAAQALWEQDAALARARIATSFELARQSQQELTTIIQTLRPVALEGKQLQRALRDYVADWQAQSCIEASYVAHGELDLPPRLEEDLFRITQEALANVARHSGASVVHVVLSVELRQARLEIVDNGRGFDPQRPARGLGLSSMRERVEVSGGTLDITSGPAGTTLALQLPYHSGIDPAPV